MIDIVCSTCQKIYPLEGVPYRCQDCGGTYDWKGLPVFEKPPDTARAPGIWRFRNALNLVSEAPIISLGEGNTPLVQCFYPDAEVYCKLEYLNPTGSFKDRGSSVLLSFLRSRGVRYAVEDSSGNAGASFAAYATRAGVSAKVYVPKSASGTKRVQIEAYGAELVAIEGPRSAAAVAVRKDADKGVPYASHAYLPFGMFGIATIAYELLEQLPNRAGTIIAPVGHGSLLLGVIRGFKALKQNGFIARLPAFVGVQTENCAPVWANFHHKTSATIEGPTIAEGIRVKDPTCMKHLIQEMKGNDDKILIVKEDEILSGRDELARQGFYVEPTSAVVWNALNQIARNTPEPIVLLLTGSGFKFRGE